MNIVDIYIYTNSKVDITAIKLNDFKNRVLTDGGLFESENCLLSQLTSMGGVYGITYNSKRLNLFTDEKISFTSSIQNINDISKIFTDFTQTFTIPADPNNNSIFKHWYENKIINGFDSRKRVDSYINIDTKLFRRGKIQLEKVNIIDGRPQSYSVTFFGSLVSLKDTFNNEFLKDLNTTAHNTEYSGAEVISKATTYSNANIKYPLISSKRLWNTTAGSTDDISQNNHAIHTEELFPALRVKTIFDIIQAQYGITFQGLGATPFLNSDKFKNAYLWLKNTDLFALKENAVRINFDDTGEDPDTGYSFNLTTQRLENNFTAPAVSGIYAFDYKEANLLITPTIAGVQFRIYIYRNGTLFSLSPFLTSVVAPNLFNIQYTTNRFATGEYFEFFIGTYQPLTFDAKIEVYTEYTDAGGGGTSYSFNVNAPIQTTPTANLQLSEYMPSIKIEEFFSGILKLFNLTCYSEIENVYIVEQLETYYAFGGTIDITPYIVVDTIDVERVKPYNKINFLYAKNEGINSVNFLGLFGRSYGDLLSEYDADGSTYDIKVPFNDFLFSKIAGTGANALNVAYCVKTDFNPFIPAPVILYEYSSTAVQTSPTFHFKDGNTVTAHTTYRRFGTETLISGTEHSINFGLELSVATSHGVVNSLFEDYYKNYIINVFDVKARMLKVKAILPSSELANLKLYNRVIFYDKKYIINSITIDLNTGESKLELLNDFRTI